MPLFDAKILSLFVGIFLHQHVFSELIADENVVVSRVERLIGHYPPDYCTISNASLLPSLRTFSARTDSENRIFFESKCKSVANIWSVKFIVPGDDGSENFTEAERSECEQIFDVGHVFTVFYYYGTSNYFHLHFDMMMPLYAAVYHRGNGDGSATEESGGVPDRGKTHVFMPSVETKRLQEMDWNTPAFVNDSKYWVQMITTIVGAHHYLPLDSRSVEHGHRVCFQQLNFGAHSVNFRDGHFISSFVRHVQRQLNIPVNTGDLATRIGLISRSNRRRIMNEDELMDGLRSLGVPVDKIVFDGMTFRDQVALMQNYSVVVGMNGAGLTNAIYLPPGAVAIQLVPKGLDVNVREFETVLRGRETGGGAYLEWWDRKPLKETRTPGDTDVDVGEVTKLVSKALEMWRSSRKDSKDGNSRKLISDEL